MAKSGKILKWISVATNLYYRYVYPNSKRYVKECLLQDGLQKEKTKKKNKTPKSRSKMKLIRDHLHKNIHIK